MGLCRSCKAPIIWARSPSGKTAILDATPNPGGNVYFREDGTVAYTKKTLPAPADAILYTSHFMNCPDRDQWRSP